MTTTSSPREAFQAAVKDIRSQGVKIAQGLSHAGCSCGCSGWKTPASWGEHPQTNYAFTRANEVKWNGNRSSSVAYWNWEGVDTDDLSVGYTLARTFAHYGFAVAWETNTVYSVRVDIASWDETKVGSVAEQVDPTEFLVEVREVAQSLLDAREAVNRAWDEQGANYPKELGERLYAANRRVDALLPIMWKVAWTDEHKDVRDATSIHSLTMSEYLVKYVNRIDEFLASA